MRLLVAIRMNTDYRRSVLPRRDFHQASSFLCWLLLWLPYSQPASGEGCNEYQPHETDRAPVGPPRVMEVLTPLRVANQSFDRTNLRG